MRILHYFLGFPPYRTGGLTKYSFDLMLAQQKQGNNVMALWPGQMLFCVKKVYMRKCKNVKGIENYELINPLPVPLDEGIKEFEEFTKSCDKAIYDDFLKKLRPDVIHIHTLMGLHKEFIESANQQKIRIIFTAHDYFGICSKVTLFRHEEVCDNDHDCIDCVQCNCSALSLNEIKILQSPLYRWIKNSFFVKKLRKQHRTKFYEEGTMSSIDLSKSEQYLIAEKYKKLREYYIEMLESIDMIHFNSTITEKIYCKYCIPKERTVFSIMHQEIQDQRKAKWYPEKKLRLVYLSPAKPFKGFKILKQALDEIWCSGEKDFVLKVYSPVEKKEPYMIIKEEGYKYSELSKIFENCDVLLAPSVWYETFGFTVLEALSYGVPVIVSDRVGAKDIIGNGGMIVKAGSVEDLKKCILELTPEKILELRTNIRNSGELKTWEQFLNENYNLYKE